MRRIAIPALLILTLLPVSARASGGPVIGVDAGSGVMSTDGTARFVTLHAGSRNTVVAEISTRDGAVQLQRGMRGYFMVPAVAYDGTGGGLSADGTTLVLIKQPFRYPVRTTQMVVIDTTRLRRERQLVLHGQLGFDAISPDGSRLYLIDYPSPRDPTRYTVRGLDVRSATLGPPIVDPREPDEKMGGLPITRTMSPAGRWAYTLYDGSSASSEGHPFIHALDTERGRAFCVDIDALAGRKDLFNLKLRVAGGGRTLAVESNGEPVALVDTKTMAVRKPASPKPPAQVEPDQSGGGRPWLVAAVLVLVLLAAAGTVLVVRSRRVAGGAKAR